MRKLYQLSTEHFFQQDLGEKFSLQLGSLFKMRLKKRNTFLGKKTIDFFVEATAI